LNKEDKLGKKLVESYHVNFDPRDKLMQEVFTEDPQPSTTAAVLGAVFVLLLIATFWM